jgi:hypothetical protein
MTASSTSTPRAGRVGVSVLEGEPDIRFNCKADVVAIRITKIHPATASPMFRARTVALSEAQFWG